MVVQELELEPHRRAAGPERASVLLHKIFDAAVAAGRQLEFDLKFKGRKFLLRHDVTAAVGLLAARFRQGKFAVHDLPGRRWKRLLESAPPTFGRLASPSQPASLGPAQLRRAHWGIMFRTSMAAAGDA